MQFYNKLELNDIKMRAREWVLENDKSDEVMNGENLILKRKFGSEMTALKSNDRRLFGSFNHNKESSNN